MAAFSRCIPVMLGTGGLVGGGVGGMSPVTRTSHSIPAQSSFRAAVGGSLKRSAEAELVGTAWSGGGVRAWDIRFGSVEGIGRGGGSAGTLSEHNSSASTTCCSFPSPFLGVISFLVCFATCLC